MMMRWQSMPSMSLWGRPLAPTSLFDDVVENMFSTVRGADRGPRWSVKDTPEALIIRADVPGLEKEELQISAEREQITLSGTRSFEPPEGYTFLQRERPAMTFSRTFSLPKTADISGAEARLEDGVLEVRVPHVPEAQPRRIPIQTSAEEVKK